MNRKEIKEARAERYCQYAENAEKPVTPTPIDWEQRKWELAKEIYAAGFNGPDVEAIHWISGHTQMIAQETIHYAEVFIEEYRHSQTNKTK